MDRLLTQKHLMSFVVWETKVKIAGKRGMYGRSPDIVPLTARDPVGREVKCDYLKKAMMSLLRPALGSTLPGR